MKKSFVACIAAAAALCGGAAQADVLISNNSAAFGNGPISTIDFTTNTPVGSFIPDGATNCAGGSCNGRGLALVQNQFYYTELNGGFGASDGIHIAPFNGGAGGHDTGFAANPIPGTGISDLAVDPNSGNLWVLAGYPGVGQAFLLNGATLALISGPVTLQGLNSGTDGFTVIPAGDPGAPAGAKFLANTGDAVNNYEYFDAAGNVIGGPLKVPGCGAATGADIAPDGNSLFFECNFNSIVQTDLSFNFIKTVPIGGLGEDIAVQQPFICVGAGCTSTSAPEPATLSILGASLLGLGALRRRR